MFGLFRKARTTPSAATVRITTESKGLYLHTSQEVPVDEQQKFETSTMDMPAQTREPTPMLRGYISGDKRRSAGVRQNDARHHNL